MSPRRQVQPARARSRRDVLVAVGASAAVILVTILLVWIIRPRDNGPEITDISETTVPEFDLPTDTGAATSVPSTPAPTAPATTAPGTTATPTPAP